MEAYQCQINKKMFLKNLYRLQIIILWSVLLENTKRVLGCILSEASYMIKTD